MSRGQAIAVTLSLMTIVCLLATSALAEEVVIELWTDHHQVDEVIFEQLVSEFESANPGIRVEYSNMFEKGYYDKIRVATAGNVLPDVFYVRPTTDFHFLGEGIIYDIDPLVSRDTDELNCEDFIDAQVAGELTYQGKWWCLPYDYSAIGLYFNKDMFSEGGLLPPNPSWTWDDVIEAGRKLTRRDHDGGAERWGFAAIHWYFSQWVEGFVMTQGGRLFNDEITQCVANNPGTVEALAIPSRMELEAQIHVPSAWGGGVEQFLAGNAAMALDGSWITAHFRENSDFTLDVTMLPQGNDHERVVSATGGAWAMASTTKHPEAAWKLLKFLASPYAVRKLIVEPVRSLPPRKSLMPDWAEQASGSSLEPAHAVHLAEQVVNYGRNVPRLPFSYDIFRGLFGEYRNKLLTGTVSPAEAAMQIERRLNAEFDRVLGEK